jgi:HrpA-like RNA helicase
VQDGICIRLYSEEDFTARPAFTQPEIQRANLAEQRGLAVQFDGGESQQLVGWSDFGHVR